MRLSKRYAIPIAAAVLLAAAAGLAWTAAIPDEQGVIHGCYQLKADGTALKGKSARHRSDRRTVRFGEGDAGQLEPAGAEGH